MRYLSLSASLLALVLLGACVSTPKLKTPCEVTMRVVRMSPEQAHARCAPGPGEYIVTDDGVMMRYVDFEPGRATVGGCALPEQRIAIVPYRTEWVVGHEVNHVLDWWCR